MKSILYIITASRFLEHFTDFIIHKQKMGFTVNTYMVENIGKGTFADIKSFLDKESDKVKDDYYLLLGGDMSIIPSELVVYVDKGSRSTDSSYAQSGNKMYWRSVGRFPAMDGSQIRNMCQKAISYEKQSGVKYGDSLLMIGATSENIIATKNMAQLLSPTISNLTGFYTDVNSKDEIVDQITANLVGFINYMGHGGSTAWTMRRLPSNTVFDSFDADDIPNFIYRQPHVLSWACNTADIGNCKCMGSKFMRQGAVSFWGACAITWGGENRRMASRFWSIYKQNCPEHIGEIYVTLYKEFYDTTKGCKRYMLLGDPTLRIK